MAESPWGEGRPGWHIECSAMCERAAGRAFDIHGGGQDLQFPHHENEIAQSEGAHGEPFVNYWMHNGFVRVDDEKMSKSLGNFFTVREVLEKIRRRSRALLHPARALPQPAQLFRPAPRRCAPGTDRLYTALKAHDVAPAPSTGTIRTPRVSAKRWTTTSTPPKRWRCCSSWRTKLNRNGSRDAAALLKSLGGMLGLLQRDPTQFLRSN